MFTVGDVLAHKSAVQKKAQAQTMKTSRSAPRIAQTDTLEDAVIKLSEGVPGAVRVLCEIINALGTKLGASMLMELDARGITGSMLWVAYKDFANENIDALLLGVMLDNQQLRELVESRSW